MATVDPTFLAFFGNERSVRLKAGDVLFKQGDSASCMYVVKRGAIRLMVGEQTVEIVEAGGMFGEMAVIDRLDRSATAVADVDCELAEIDEQYFVSMLRAAPMFGLNLLRLMTRRLRAMDKLIQVHQGVQEPP